MKAKSKLLALLLALAMVFSLTMPAFAADDETAAEDTEKVTETAEDTDGDDAEAEAPAEDGADDAEPAESEPIEDTTFSSIT